MELYQWQKRCLSAWEKNGRRGIVNVVTGAGKTVLALEAWKRLRSLYPELRLRIVVPTIPLANQWKQAILRAAETEEERPGLFGGDRRDRPDRRVMIYIINSARETLSGHIKKELALHHPLFLVGDECHHYQSRENRKIFRFAEEETDVPDGLYFCMGLSATPFDTADDVFLRRVLGREVFRYGFDQGVEEGIISPFFLCSVSVSFLGKESMQYAELSEKISVLLARIYKIYPSLKGLPEADFMRALSAIAKKADMDPSEPAVAFLLLTYRRKEISVLAECRTRCCRELLKRLDPSDRVLIFCERTEQAEAVCRNISRFGPGRCGLYHSGMTKEARKRVMDAFRENSNRILVSCRCLDEGIDVPDANIGIVISSSAVPRQRIQRLGRLIRRRDGKDAACLYYLYVREASDDAAYLSGLENCEAFDLRYYSAEEVFSADIYEYAGRELLRRAEEKGVSREYLKELRRCLADGLPRADCLLPDKLQNEKVQKAESSHEKNYWRVMRKMGGLVREGKEGC